MGSGVVTMFRRQKEFMSVVAVLCQRGREETRSRVSLCKAFSYVQGKKRPRLMDTPDCAKKEWCPGILCRGLPGASLSLIKPSDYELCMEGMRDPKFQTWR